MNKPMQHPASVSVAELVRVARKEAGHDAVEMGFASGILGTLADRLERIHNAGVLLFERVDHIGCKNCKSLPCPSCREAIDAWESAGGGSDRVT